MGVQNVFTIVILIQLFFSLGMTGISHYMPEDARNYIEPFKEFSDKTDFEDVQQKTQDNLEKQTNIPVIELGALVFYSGNLLLDFILNFAFAVPGMLTLLVKGVTTLVNVPQFAQVQLQLFVGVAVSVLYFISIIRFLVGIRSGRIA